VSLPCRHGAKFRVPLRRRTALVSAPLVCAPSLPFPPAFGREGLFRRIGRSAFWREVFNHAESVGVPIAHVAEEVAAYAIEAREQVPPGIREAIDNFIGSLKAWALRRFGVQFGEVTPAQLHPLAITALRSWRGESNPTTPGGGRQSSDDARFSAGEAPAREFGLPSEAGTPVFAFRNDQPMKRHPNYTAAKSGDIAAAARLVGDIVPRANLEEAARRFGKDAIYVPVHAEEASGRNALPATLAVYYADEAGGRVSSDIVQASKTFHTGASAMERIISRPKFGGKAERGGRYVIVDDVSVMGATLAELAHHIRTNGGEVVGSVLLVNASRSGSFTSERARVRAVERRFGDAIRQELGVEPAALTGPEADYLLNFRDADALRSRIAAAKSARNDRLRAKGVLGEESRSGEEGGSGPVGGEPRYSMASPERFKLVDQTKSLFDKASKKASDFLTDAMGRNETWNILKLVPVRPLFLELAKGMPSARFYVDTKQAMDAMRLRLNNEDAILLNKWSKWVRETKISTSGIQAINKAANQNLMDIMHDSTLEQIDPSKPFEAFFTKEDEERLK